MIKERFLIEEAAFLKASEKLNFKYEKDDYNENRPRFSLSQNSTGLVMVEGVISPDCDILIYIYRLVRGMPRYPFSGYNFIYSRKDKKSLQLFEKLRQLDPRDGGSKPTLRDLYRVGLTPREKDDKTIKQFHRWQYRDGLDTITDFVFLNREDAENHFPEMFKEETGAIYSGEIYREFVLSDNRVVIRRGWYSDDVNRANLDIYYFRGGIK